MAGDHALCCSHNGVYRRHNHVRDRLFALAESANWRPELEVALPVSRTRPADILLRGCDPRPLAIDVTISHPLRFSASSAVRGGRTSAAEEAENRKIALGKQACKDVGWGFLPFAVDVTGGFGHNSSWGHNSPWPWHRAEGRCCAWQPPCPAADHAPHTNCHTTHALYPPWTADPPVVPHTLLHVPTRTSGPRTLTSHPCRIVHLGRG